MSNSNRSLALDSWSFVIRPDDMSDQDKLAGIQDYRVYIQSGEVLYPFMSFYLMGEVGIQHTRSDHCSYQNLEDFLGWVEDGWSELPEGDFSERPLEGNLSRSSLAISRRDGTVYLRIFSESEDSRMSVTISFRDPEELREEVHSFIQRALEFESSISAGVGSSWRSRSQG